MFYSHQLLARKAPLGQIWMAATMHAKINRRKLDKLNIITICEEILNPSVPMALRLSGILMGGVVIVYERKVKLLYDDVTRFLLEINEAWKIKPLADPTVLPKGKSHAKYEAVTLPANDNEQMDVGEIEQSLHFSNTTTTMRFQETGYFTMRLDHVDEPFINDDNPRGEDLSQHHHQAEAANITLFDRFDSYQADASLFNRFERFDIEGDEDGQTNFTANEYSQVPTTLIPSPPPQEETAQADEIQDQHPETRDKQQSDECRDEAHQAQQEEQRRGPTKRKARTKTSKLVMDYEQTIIPGHIYQAWLQNTSNIVSERGRKKKVKVMSTMKTIHLMELPPVALLCGLSGNGTREIHYPAPLLDLWMRCTHPQPGHDSPSGRTSPPPPLDPSSSSAPDRLHNQDPLEFPVEDFHSGVGSHPKQVSVEKQMPNLDNIEFPVNEANLMFTPGNSGDNERSIPSSASGNGFLSLDPEVQLPSGRSNVKRPYSSSRQSGSNLAPVAEENPWELPEPVFKLRRLSEYGASHEQEMLIETEPTQTQHPLVDHSIDKITDEIRKQLKTHFDTPGAPELESINQLASGMNRKKAAHLFYQTCVLATHDLLRVQQTVAYGDILISKGSKM